MSEDSKRGKETKARSGGGGNLLVIPPRLVIAAPQGRSGKTTITIGLARALSKRGFAVQCFKKGPDYIDPSWLRLASGRDCFNLDNFLMSDEVVRSSFASRSRDADVALIEGAMGLFDSPASDGKGSVAWLARFLKTPVILVVNAERMTRSVAALVKGFQQFEPETQIAGVILNRVAGSRHVAKLKDALDAHCAIPVVGAVPRNPALSIAERHLGLTPSGEKLQSESIVSGICDKVEAHLDIPAIISLARSAETQTTAAAPRISPRRPTVRIGVVSGPAFTFYYPDNIEALQDAGAEVVYVDAFSDRALPEVDGLYIGGGFPELYASELEANSGLRRSISQEIERGLPTYAECAGLMYLGQAIRWQGKRFEMVGKVQSEVEISSRPQGHGYVELEVSSENPWFSTGTLLRGHEFHHSLLIATGKDAPRGEKDPRTHCCCTVLRGRGIDGRVDGFTYKNLFASYTHLHAAATPAWAPAFVRLAKEYKRQVKIEFEVEKKTREKQRKQPKSSRMLGNG